LDDLIQINTNSMELLNDAGSEYTAGTKLHFKIRMKAKDYKGKLSAAYHFTSALFVSACACVML
jgi:stress-induced morphogen